MKMPKTLILAFITSATFAFAGAPPQPVTEVFDALISATINNDYEKFQQLGDSAFREEASREMFEKLSNQVGALFKDGYKSLRK